MEALLLMTSPKYLMEHIFKIAHLISCTDVQWMVLTPGGLSHSYEML